MNKKNIPFIVQLKQNNNYIVQGINQNDAGIIFDIKIMDGLEAFNFSGYSLVTLKIVKPDETITYDSTGGNNVDVVDSVNGRLKINIPTSCTAQNGMHFCTIGFTSDGETIFEATSFNYYVGVSPTASDDDIIGTNEYPVLANLIAKVSELDSNEQQRIDNEELREGAEEHRQAQLDQMTALLLIIQQRLNDTQDMLIQLNQAIADGGSIDISTINALATRAYVHEVLEEESGVEFLLEEDADEGGLGEGKLAYTTDTKKLLMGYTGETLVQLNEPCYLISSSEPDDTSKLWIDTTNNTMKFYYDEAWRSLYAVFA